MINFIYLACKDLHTLVPGSLREREERGRTRFIETVVVLIMQEASLCDKTFILMMTTSSGYCSHFHFKKDIDKGAQAPNRYLTIMSQIEGLREKGFFDLPTCRV